jgi:hypothetical protein
MSLQDMVGKTITRVEKHEGQYSISGTVSITLHFDDGTYVEIDARGCDEGGWLEFRGEYRDED